MAKKSKFSQDKLGMIGHWLFMVAVIMILLVGFFKSLNPIAIPTLVLFGLIVGFINVTEKETTNYLVAAIVLVFVAGYGMSTFGQLNIANISILNALSAFLQRIFSSTLIFAIPATVVVALKSIYRIAANK